MSNIYSKFISFISKFSLEKQLNTIHKRKHANYTNNIVKKKFNKKANPQKDSISSYKYENITTKKLTTEQKKTEKENNKNEIKQSWLKETCVAIGDSMVAGMDERKMSI